MNEYNKLYLFYIFKNKEFKDIFYSLKERLFIFDFQCRIIDLRPRSLKNI